MMIAVLTMAITADTKEQLDADTETILTIARKHMCQIGIALMILLVMAAVLSIRAHAADSPQAVIDADGSGTTISVTDITPREDNIDGSEPHAP